jgi:hypothetical protein
MAKKKPGVVYFEPGGALIEIIPGVTTKRRFVILFPVDGVGDVELDVAVTKGRARAVSVTIAESAPGAGVTGVSLENTSVQQLLEKAVASAALIFKRAAGRNPLESGVSRELNKTVRVRQRASAERLQQVADAYARDGLDGIIDMDIATRGEPYTERHARRLKRRAEEAGLILKKGQR